MEKDRLTTAVLTQLENDLEPEQLRKVKLVITIQLKKYRVQEEKNEVAIYDETSDIAAYQAYFVSKKIQGLSAKSLQQYRYTIDRFMRTVQRAYQDVTTNDIRLYLANREMVDGLSNASMLRERGVLVRFFKWLHVEEYIERDPGARVEPIKKVKRLKYPFTDFEVEQLRNASAQRTKDRAVIEMLLSTGCRVSELVSLTMENYDRSSGKISVIGKGNKERILLLNAKAELALKNYLREYPHMSGPIIWGRTQGQPMTVSGIQKLTRRVGSIAGVECVHPHRFRRTAGSQALARGMALDKIRIFLGHESMDTTLLYAITTDEDFEHSHRKYVS